MFPASTQGEIDAFKTGMMESDVEDEDEDEAGGGKKKNGGGDTGSLQKAC